MSNYTLLLEPANVDVNDLEGVINWFAPALLAVDPAGIIAVWMTWESVADDGKVNQWSNDERTEIQSVEPHGESFDLSTRFSHMDMDGQEWKGNRRSSLTTIDPANERVVSSVN